MHNSRTENPGIKLVIHDQTLYYIRYQTSLFEVVSQYSAAAENRRLLQTNFFFVNACHEEFSVKLLCHLFSCWSRTQDNWALSGSHNEEITFPATPQKRFTEVIVFDGCRFPEKYSQCFLCTGSKTA